MDACPNKSATARVFAPLEMSSFANACLHAWGFDGPLTPARWAILFSTNRIPHVVNGFPCAFVNMCSQMLVSCRCWNSNLHVALLRYTTRFFPRFSFTAARPLHLEFSSCGIGHCCQPLLSSFLNSKSFIFICAMPAIRHPVEANIRSSNKSLVFFASPNIRRLFVGVMYFSPRLCSLMRFNGLILASSKPFSFSHLMNMLIALICPLIVAAVSFFLLAIFLFLLPHKDGLLDSSVWIACKVSFVISLGQVALFNSG